MYLEAVTVCVDYGDFLKEVIPWNQHLFDRWAIVTTPADEETRELCRRNGLECYTTDEFYRERDEFNKGRGIAIGVDHLSQRDWVLHLDADMVLPPLTRQFLRSADLHPDVLYGCDRAMCVGWDKWQDFKRSGYLQHGNHRGLNFPKSLRLGTRWCSPRHGYCPIGAFQLWHGSVAKWRGINTRAYPHQHNDAARSDIQHSLHWDRRNRAILPEIVAIHLESEPCPLGANWKGRTTRRFEAPNPLNPMTDGAGAGDHAQLKQMHSHGRKELDNNHRHRSYG
jgi:hypothetical protein